MRRSVTRGLWAKPVMITKDLTCIDQEAYSVAEMCVEELSYAFIPSVYIWGLVPQGKMYVRQVSSFDEQPCCVSVAFCYYQRRCASDLALTSLFGVCHHK